MVVDEHKAVAAAPALLYSAHHRSAPVSLGCSISWPAYRPIGLVLNMSRLKWATGQGFAIIGDLLRLLRVRNAFIGGRYPRSQFTIADRDAQCTTMSRYGAFVAKVSRCYKC